MRCLSRRDPQARPFPRRPVPSFLPALEGEDGPKVLDETETRIAVTTKTFQASPKYLAMGSEVEGDQSEKLERLTDKDLPCLNLPSVRHSWLRSANMRSEDASGPLEMVSQRDSAVQARTTLQSGILRMISRSTNRRSKLQKTRDSENLLPLWYQNHGCCSDSELSSHEQGCAAQLDFPQRDAVSLIRIRRGFTTEVTEDTEK